MLAKLRDGIHTISGLAHYLDAIHDVEQRHQPLANNVMVFHHKYANQFLFHFYSASRAASPGPALGAGACRRTDVPVPGSLVTSRVPPMAAVRSRIPVNP